VPESVYVRSQKAGERVMALLKRRYDKLHLKINESKSAVAKAFGRKFLGCEMWMARRGEVRRAVSKKALEAFRQKIRQLTRRSGGRSINAGTPP
jgi:RNA-directed DNA polymerase